MGCFDFFKCLKRNRKPKIHPYMTEEEMEGMKPQKPYGKKWFRLEIAPPPRGLRILFTLPILVREVKPTCWIVDRHPIIYPCPPPPPPSPLLKKEKSDVPKLSSIPRKNRPKKNPLLPPGEPSKRLRCVSKTHGETVCPCQQI